jgi:hypothetical protein
LKFFAIHAIISPAFINGKELS